MSLRSGFENIWRNYCMFCEWEEQCHQEVPCEHFQPIDWTEFYMAEIVDNQDERQAEYLLVVEELGGGD